MHVRDYWLYIPNNLNVEKERLRTEAESTFPENNTAGEPH